MAQISPWQAANYKPKPRPPPPKPSHARALEAAVSVNVTLGNVFTLTPPLVISEGDLDRVLGHLLVHDCRQACTLIR